jgi:CHAT domain-containing protein
MKPLVDALMDLSIERAVLISQGYLGLLPLHAAWTETNGKRRYAMDHIRFTFAPNARSLAAEVTEAHNLLAIDNPDGSLLFSNEEVAAALDTFPASHRLHLANTEATLERVRSALAHHDVWHFSTHGEAGWREPLESNLLLAHGEHLTLRELLALRGQARLAVLSACETGVPGMDLPDEVIGLPTGMLQAGVAGVVGSLWSVNDFSTALLMMRFYEAWREEGQAPPEALHRAQCWLRDATTADLEAYFKAQLPDTTTARLPGDVATAGYRRFWWADDKQARPFEHPFHWAGFYYTGV